MTTWSDERLQAALTSLADEIDWPDGSDLTLRVAGQIRPRPSFYRRWLAFGTAVLVAFLLLLSAPGQEAVAWLLRVAGIRVELVESEVPTGPPISLVGGVDSSLAEAEEELGFNLRRPRLLGPPESVQLLRWGGGQQVAMIWSESDDLPEVFDTGVGLLLVQFEAKVEQELLLKQASDATRIQPVRINGDLGYFLSEAPHTVFFESKDGLITDDQVRLTGNVLVWMSDGVTYRIESALGLVDSVEIAESLD
ncbi:MAG TPA: hypothetical protein VJQ57_03520 [Acidimicrobiia bacterium]|nr:hypothetical protein [Acidimicrobiia bacterium]